jgi:transcriptional regulator with XRE-family HTH domain
MRGIGLEEDREQVEAMIRRLARRREELGLSIRQMAAKAGIDPTALSRLERGERVPETRTILRLVQAMGRTVEWAFGLVEPPPSVVDDDEQTLLGFLAEVQTLGIAQWAASAPRGETPTVSEVLRALQALKDSPTGLDGVPIDGWGKWFREMRRTGFELARTKADIGVRGPSTPPDIDAPVSHQAQRPEASEKRRGKTRG